MGLKAVPNKNAGFIILLTSITFFFIFGEIRNLTALCLLNNNGFSLSSFFLCSLSFLWIGAQFPQEKFLSYGRILTLHYYFLLMCILLSLMIFMSFHKTRNQIIHDCAEGIHQLTIETYKSINYFTFHFFFLYYWKCPAETKND